jgi:hypothetical protein
MKTDINLFEKPSGSDRIRSPLVLVILVLTLGLMALSIWKFGAPAGMMFTLMIAGLAYLYILFQNPATGLYTAVAAGFLLLGLGRYLKDIPVGLAMDGILVLTYIALFFKNFYKKPDLSPFKKDITLLSAVWFAYSLMQLFNPEARSVAAWFSGRGTALYMMLIVPLTLLFINDKRKLDTFFLVWGIFSLLATLKGIIQVEFGVDLWEKAWLNEGNYRTHIIQGQLRAFSFLSDAGQFGANQAYSAMVALIVSFSVKEWPKRVFFLGVALLGLYGMVISGTRGALSVPLTGFFLFFILRKNKTVLITGILLLLATFYFFKFTYIGQSNYNIRRMRSAFNPDDPSLQVRLENQKRLRTYMATRPFGGGIGHGGVKAQKYLPYAYLSQIPTDSWYVLIWVEQGIVGLVLHLLILFYILGKSCFLIMFKIRDPQLKLKMAALASGMCGIMVASYGNAVLGQMPTSILIYSSMALLMNMKTLDTTEEDCRTKLIEK